MKITSIFFALLLSTATIAQSKKNVVVNFNAVYNSQKLQFDSVQYLVPNTTDSVTFTNLKFYISNIVLLNNKKKVFVEKNSYHLIDVTNNKDLQFVLKVPSTLHYNNIKFDLGIDSATNASGVHGKDLDPIKGMYWAWHSGYINFKLEGNSKLCNTRNNAFEFHLGGFQYPYNALQKIVLKVEAKKDINIDADIYKFLSAINLSNTNQIMTPGKQAVELSKAASTIFSIKK